MASWKKVIVSGSAISQLNNDANFISSTGGGILSGSAQIAADISGSFTSTSASLASDIAGISTSFTLSADSGTNDTFNSSETLTFSGGNGIDTVVSDNNIAINGVAGLVSGSAQVVALVEAGTDSNTFTDADHSKLNAIEASADVTDTANVTSAGAVMDSEVTDLAGIKGVTISTLQVKPSEGAFADGDKTKLDAIEASADVTDTTNVTAAGALMDSECSSLASVKAINQGLTTSSDVSFDSIGIGTAAPGTSGVIRAANDIVAFYSSDERLKDNIEVIPNCLGRLKDIKGVEFDWNDKQSVYQGHDIGVIAQDIEKIAPSLVTDRDNGFKAVKYEKLTAILIQAVKELAAKVEELENK